MRVFVVVNCVSEVTCRQTTALLIASLIADQHEVHLASVDGFRIHGDTESTNFLLSSVQISNTSPYGQLFDSSQVERFCSTSEKLIAEERSLNADDLILIRTNPGRDLDRSELHDSFLEFCAAVGNVGVRVVNSPEKLRFLASKASLSLVDPMFRAPMLVSYSLNSIVDFIRSSKVDCVVKPLIGSRGQNVIRVKSIDNGLLESLTETFGSRGVVAQHFVRSDEPGDKRVVVLDGHLIEVEGGLAGIHRVPAEGDFRANLHAGGSAKPLELSKSQRHAVIHAAEILMSCGIRLAGIDLVGDKIIEFNVFSTGGLYDAIRFAEHDFATEISRRLIED